MRINNISNNLNATKFYGIQKPYTDDKGRYVIPISKVPSDGQIDTAIVTTLDEKQEGMQGYNGEAFYCGKDLVVKRYKGANALNDDPMREIKILDTMYENNLHFNDSQRGHYAFRTPEGEYFLVSTKVKGESPQVNKTPFTRENLSSIVDIVIQMDRGTIIKNSALEESFSDRCRFMNYDFNGRNMKITSKSAGLFDFEYSEIENIDNSIYKSLITEETSPSCHQSDTSGLASSLRSFEFFTLYEYLMRTDNPDEIFEEYLALKSKYHSSMSEFFKEFSKESAFPEIAKSISIKEGAHSRLLFPDIYGVMASDIKKAEAIKIQMAVFIHDQSSFCETGEVNPSQLADFTKDAIIYFQDNLKRAKSLHDNDRQIYYTDCLKLFLSWRMVNRNVASKIENNNPKIIRKLTSDTLPTLLDVLNFKDKPSRMSISV